VSPYLGTDIWQGKSLDGLWFNTHRLIYLHRLSAAIQGGTPLKETSFDVGEQNIWFFENLIRTLYFVCVDVNDDQLLSSASSCQQETRVCQTLTTYTYGHNRNKHSRNGCRCAPLPTLFLSWHSSAQVKLYRRAHS
jgi:hypothetical protein